MSVKNLLVRFPVSCAQLLARGVAIVFVPLLLAGAIVRLTVADRYVATAILYYMSPPAGIALMAGFAACFLPRSKTKTRVAMASVCAASVFWTLSTQWVAQPSKVSPAAAVKPVRVLVWNVFEGKFGWPAIVEIIQAEDPDIIALAEVGPVKDPGSDFFAKHFPNYRMETIPRQLVILSRLPIEKMERQEWDLNGVYESIQLSVPNGGLTVLFADVKSSPLIHRDQPMSTLTRIAESLPGPVIAVGDWNTPVDSRFLESFRDTFTNAFETSGHGLHTTWPMPLPVQAIDHIWGRQVRFLQTRILRTVRSDHCPIVADFEITPLNP